MPRVKRSNGLARALRKARKSSPPLVSEESFVLGWLAYRDALRHRTDTTYVNAAAAPPGIVGHLIASASHQVRVLMSALDCIDAGCDCAFDPES